VVFILITVPLVARRFGPIPASLLALGFAAVYPFYDFFSVGYFDHHGLASTWDLLTVILIVAGGAGWLRVETADASSLGPDEQLLWKWLPTGSQARRWFVASAIVGGAGLWESAATTVPAMVGIGIGAIIGTAWLGRRLTAKSPWRVDPTLWRTWGQAGCAASLFFYCLEYFPGHLGWNLEINHPLYALAWLGAGDLLCRACEWILRGELGATSAEKRRSGLFIGMDLLMVAVLPVTIALTSKYTFVTSDYFLWSLCADYILEIQSLFRQLASMGASEILGRIGLAPLLLLPAIVLLWKTELQTAAARVSWRALLVLSLAPALVFAHAIFYAFIFRALQDTTWLSGGPTQAATFANSLALVLDLLTVTLLFAVPIYAEMPTLPIPWKGLLSVAMFPAVVLLALALQESRWLGVNCAVSLGALLAVALVCGNTRALDRRFSLAAGILVALVLLPFPAYTIAGWTRAGLKMPVSQLDLTQVITRDASYRIRQRLGNEPGVIVSGPSTTTWMTYFGGFKGLGTLYADNLEGLKAVAAIYSASSAEDALELCRKYGVTHLAIYSWDTFAEEYAKLSRGLRRPDPVPTDAFMLRILRDGSIPSWLRPIPYSMPQQRDLAKQYVRLLEVVPDQSLEEATVRVAQYLWAMNKPDEAVRQLSPLLARGSDYLPALVCLAQVQQSRGDVSAFRQTVQQIRTNLGKAGTMPLEDRVGLAMVMAFANDPSQVREQLTGALQAADERSVRHLLPDTLMNLVDLTRQMKLTDQYARTYQLAVDLLPPEAKAAL
jgi:hypothetical protein